MARRTTTPEATNPSADDAGAGKAEDGLLIQPCTTDDLGARDVGSVSRLVDDSIPGGFVRGAVGSRWPSPRSLAAVVLSITARREAAPARRARIERGVADLDVRAELLADLDAAHARAEAADLAELLAGAPEGRA